MLRTPAIFVICLSTLGFSQSSTITVGSAADGSSNLTAGSLAAIIGSNLSGQTAKADTPPWPTSLGGVSVQVQDSGSVTRPAGILFVSPGQINFQIPPATALGMATVIVQNGGAAVSTLVPVRTTAPSLFEINELAVAAATAVRITIPTQIQSPVPVFLCVDTPGSCRLTPIDPGLDAPVYLSFYGTGIRGTDVQITIGGMTMAASYAGPQGQFPGLDQVNVGLPLSLRGAGEVSVTVTAGGITSNAVKISVK